MIHPLTAWRRAKGLTLEQLGEKLGVSAAALSRYEGGKRMPKRAIALAIEQATAGEVTRAQLDDAFGRAAA